MQRQVIQINGPKHSQPDIYDVINPKIKIASSAKQQSYCQELQKIKYEQVQIPRHQDAKYD